MGKREVGARLAVLSVFGGWNLSVRYAGGFSGVSTSGPHLPYPKGEWSPPGASEMLSTPRGMYSRRRRNDRTVRFRGSWREMSQR